MILKYHFLTAVAAVFAMSAFAQTTTSGNVQSNPPNSTGTLDNSDATTNTATGDSSTTMADQTSTTTNQMQMGRDPAMIRSVQQALNDRGHDVGRVDGVWGSRSASALRDFQRSQGITSTGGNMFDQRTLSALGVQGTSTSTSTSSGTGLGTSSSPNDMPADSTTRQGRSPSSTVDDTAPTNPSGTGTGRNPGQR